MNKTIIRCDKLSKEFQDGSLRTQVLKDINLIISAGAKVAIVGASGSGKSTLLHALAGLEAPSQGTVTILGHDTSKVSDPVLSRLRRQHLGFIYQHHHLLPEFTALENIAMPLLIARTPKQAALSKAQEFLAMIGLKHRQEHKTMELSGGERQRVAIARAAITKPQCILADEPTGNLDSKNVDVVFELLDSLNTLHQTALVLVTHDEKLAAKMEHRYQMEDGALK